MSASEYCTPTTNKSELTQQDGGGKKTSVTIIFFEITFRQNSLSFKQIFCKDQKTLMLGKDHDETRK